MSVRCSRTPLDQNARSASFTIGTPGELYAFRVRAENLGGLNPPSNGYYIRR
jgi:hypothetical protein